MRKTPNTSSTLRGSIVDSAERLFRRTGFHKTTVADIAREAKLSATILYRVFKAKSEIDQAVCRRLFAEIESSTSEIVNSQGPAKDKLREVIVTIKRINTRLFMTDARLHELLTLAHTEDWPIVREHLQWMDDFLTEIIRRGMETGEFAAGDAELAAILFRSLCLNACKGDASGQNIQPTLEQLVNFGLAALTNQSGCFGHDFPTG